MKNLLTAPLVVLPITAVALGLILVPFVVWNVDHAAQFYGAFFAAIVAAAAAFSGYFIQHSLALAREQKTTKEKHISEIVDLYFWLRYIKNKLKSALAIIDKHLNGENQPDNNEEFFFKFTDVARKKLVFSDIISETRANTAKALRLPARFRVITAGRMMDVCDHIEDMKMFLGEDAEVMFNKKAVERFRAFYGKHLENIEKVTKNVEEYLRENNALN